MKEQIKQIREVFKNYIINNNIKSVIIGVSGGLDSAVNAALLYPVCQELQIPLIGRYIHIESNTDLEKDTANFIGHAFCNNYREINLDHCYYNIAVKAEGRNDDFKIRGGNIKARLRMIYLRDLAKLHSGIMIDNTNKSEYNLGFFTIADGGDYAPLFNLWKTEVYNLAKELVQEYSNSFRGECLQKAINMIPTDGLGISNSDLEQIGAESYEQVDYILQEILAWKWLSNKRENKYNSVKEMRNAFLEEQQTLNIPIDVIIAVTDRHFNSEFKRKGLPIKINREDII